MDIYERADYQCEICGSTRGLQKHHIVKRSQLGSDTQENLILLCWECHHGNKGVHGKNGSWLDKQLKLGLQEYYFKQGKNKEEVRKLMGNRLYLKNNEIYGIDDKTT